MDQARRGLRWGTGGRDQNLFRFQQAACASFEALLAELRAGLASAAAEPDTP